VGTSTLEILETLPDADAIFVAVGGGSGVSAACLVGKTVNPGLAVYGVQAEGAPAAYEGWKQRKLVVLDRADTFAEGVATREANDLPARLFWDRVDAITLVSDQALKRSMVTILEHAHILAEGAGAAALAGAISLADQLQGKKVVCVVSGGNVTLKALKTIVNEEQPW
jgi:threonine dehydratase